MLYTPAVPPPALDPVFFTEPFFGTDPHAQEFFDIGQAGDETVLGKIISTTKVVSPGVTSGLGIEEIEWME